MNGSNNHDLQPGTLPEARTNDQRQDRATLRWEVDRYVLNDPTQDRAAFEAMMLDQPELAEMVAEAVEQCQVLAMAQRRTERAEAVRHRWLGKEGTRLATAGRAMWALAAATALVIFSAWWVTARHDTAVRPTVEQPQIAELAMLWAMLDSAPEEGAPAEVRSNEIGDETGLKLDAIATNAIATNTDSASPEPTEMDWILEIGPAFFRDSAAQYE